MNESKQFRDYWMLEKGEMTIEKFVDDRLSEKELMKVRDIIAIMQAKGLPSNNIIKALQNINSKLMEKWKAERAYYTEVKRQDTRIVVNASKDLDIHKYRVVLSPHACPICVAKSNNGKKIFSTAEVSKGEGQFVPWHPNCFCVVLPVG